MRKAQPPLANTVTVRCPSLACRSLLRVPETVRGKKVRCGRCGMVFSVPLRAGGTVANDTAGPSGEP